MFHADEMTTEFTKVNEKRRAYIVGEFSNIYENTQLFSKFKLIGSAGK